WQGTVLRHGARPDVDRGRRLAADIPLGKSDAAVRGVVLLVPGPCRAAQLRSGAGRPFSRDQGEPGNDARVTGGREELVRRDQAVGAEPALAERDALSR